MLYVLGLSYGGVEDALLALVLIHSTHLDFWK
jgi:hypothetical protein